MSCFKILMHVQKSRIHKPTKITTSLTLPLIRAINWFRMTVIDLKELLLQGEVIFAIWQCSGLWNVSFSRRDHTVLLTWKSWWLTSETTATTASFPLRSVQYQWATYQLLSPRKAAMHPATDSWHTRHASDVAKSRQYEKLYCEHHSRWIGLN